MTREEEDAILAQAEAITKQRNEVRFDEAQTVERHAARLWNNPAMTDPFTLDELRFASVARCGGCGMGMAYPKKIGVQGAWHCSGVLLKTAPKDATSHDRLPFMCYEIKSEDQPSAKGATTRPAPA